MEDEKRKCEPPRAMRLDDKALGKGNCFDGSGDSGHCVDFGSSAQENCAYPGNTATSLCDLGGNTPGGGCFSPGNGP